MIGMPFLAIGISLSGALQGAGDTFATMRIIFTGMWLLRIPLILAVIYILRTSALGIWWSMTISIVIMCGMLANRFRGNAWIKVVCGQDEQRHAVGSLPPTREEQRKAGIKSREDGSRIIALAGHLPRTNP